MSRYLNSRTAATALGAIATAGAIGLLVADGFQSGHWTVEHAFVPVVVLLTVGAGHLAVSALRAWRPFAALGFGLAFLLGTLVSFSNGAGRLAEGQATKANGAETINRAISDKQAEITEARTRLATAQANVERETKNGCKALCKDWKARAGEIDSHLAILQVQLQKLGAPQVANVKAQKVGRIAHLFFGLDADHIANAFGEVEPLLLPMLLELVAIAGFGFGLGHRTAAKVAAELPTPPGRKSRRGIKQRDGKVVAFVDRYRAAHGKDPSIPEMLAAFPGMPTSTAQRYRKSGGNVVAMPLPKVATA